MLAFVIAAETAAHADSPAFPPFEPWHFPSQIFWTIILFSAMYFALSRFILPKLGSVIEVRETKIANDLDEAASLSHRAEEAKKALELSLAEARNKARETANKARAKIDAEISEETAKVDAELGAKLAEAETRISTLRSEAMSNVENIAVEAMQAITEQFDIKTGAADAKTAVAKAVAN